jgi:hypothetical protein
MVNAPGSARLVALMNPFGSSPGRSAARVPAAHSATPTPPHSSRPTSFLRVLRSATRDAAHSDAGTAQITDAISSSDASNTSTNRSTSASVTASDNATNPRGAMYTPRCNTSWNSSSLRSGWAL